MRTIVCCLCTLLICALASAQDLDNKRRGDTLRLLGVWESNCYNPSQITPRGQNIYVRDIYTFGAGGSYTLETSHYSDANCSEPQGNPESFFGDYSLGEPLEELETKNLRRINFTLDNADWPAQLAPANLQWVMSFNKDRLYFGAYNPPFTLLTPGVWFEKNLTPNNGLFVF